MTTQRPRPRWQLMAIPVGLACVPLMAGLYWIERPHDIVYRATADGCESYSVRYATHDGEEGPLSASGAFTTPIVALVHGDVASLVATSGPGCTLVRCEIEEDGRVVAHAAGTAAALCSAWTAR